MTPLAVIVFVDLITNCVAVNGVANGNLLIVKIVVVYTLLAVILSILTGKIGCYVISLIMLIIHANQLSGQKQQERSREIETV